MNVCRTCLADKTDKDIFNVKMNKEFKNKTFVDMMIFCLDIMVVKNPTITTKLCAKCYRKILSFHKFKSLAIENDIYLESQCTSAKHQIPLNNNENEIGPTQQFSIQMVDCLSPEMNNKDIIFREQVKTEMVSAHDAENDSIELGKSEPPELESDDEYLSVIKTIKMEYGMDGKDAKIKRKNATERKSNSKKIDNPKNNLKMMCEECGITVKDLKEHMRQHLPPDERPRVNCHLCEETFSSANSKYKHVRRKHMNIKQNCKICNKAVANLKAHILVVHNTESLPFECIACGRGFISKSRLDVHMAVHTKDRPHKCSFCIKRFRTKICMQLHERQVHKKEKNHLCQFCSKTFFKKYHLQVHIRTHTKEKPYECSECGKWFSSKNVLKNHKLIHEDVKRFACTLCDMSFIRNGYLHAHMLSHKKEKRFECQYCGAKFHRSDHRRRHEHTVHRRHLDNAHDTPFTAI
ncbi:zinc finger protein 1 homolog [Bombyx mori]|uniref:zinc finger protein 1 homolog n=1 Tax=Bombyx mori TaxID=7091 RepID=UPI002ED49D0A